MAQIRNNQLRASFVQEAEPTAKEVGKSWIKPSTGEYFLSKQVGPESFIKENAKRFLIASDANGTGTEPEDLESVTTWIDLSGNGNNATLTGTPAYNLAEKAIQVDASDAVIFDGAMGEGTKSIFFVLQKRAGGDVNGRVMQTTVGNVLIGHYLTNGDVIYIDGNPSVLSGPNNLSKRVYSLEYLTDSSLVFRGTGNTLVTDTSANSLNGRVLSINTPNEPSDVYVQAFVEFDKALTVDEREQVESYLAHKFGIEADLPAGHTYKSAAPTTSLDWGLSSNINTGPTNIYKAKEVKEPLTNVVSVNDTTATFTFDSGDGYVNASAITTSALTGNKLVEAFNGAGNHSTAAQPTETITITFDKEFVLSKLRGAGRQFFEFFKDYQLELFDKDDNSIYVANSSVVSNLEFFEFTPNKKISKLIITGSNRTGTNAGMNLFEFFTTEKVSDYAEPIKHIFIPRDPVVKTLSNIVEVSAVEANFEIDGIDTTITTNSSFPSGTTYGIAKAITGGDHATNGFATEIVTITFDEPFSFSKIRGKGRPSGIEYYSTFNFQVFNENDDVIGSDSDTVSSGTEYFDLITNSLEISKLVITATGKVGSNPGINSIEIFGGDGEATISTLNRAEISNKKGTTKVTTARFNNEEKLIITVNGEEKAMIDESGYYYNNGTTASPDWNNLKKSITSIVDAGVVVTLGGLSVAVPGSGNRGLQLKFLVTSTVSGVSENYYPTSGFGGETTRTGWHRNQDSFAANTWIRWEAALNFNSASVTQIIVLSDQTSNKMYRVSLIIGSGYNNNFISIERL